MCNIRFHLVVLCGAAVMAVAGLSGCTPTSSSVTLTPETPEVETRKAQNGRFGDDAKGRLRIQLRDLDPGTVYRLIASQPCSLFEWDSPTGGVFGGAGCGSPTGECRCIINDRVNNREWLECADGCVTGRTSTQTGNQRSVSNNRNASELRVDLAAYQTGCECMLKLDPDVESDRRGTALKLRPLPGFSDITYTSEFGEVIVRQSLDHELWGRNTNSPNPHAVRIEGLPERVYHVAMATNERRCLPNLRNNEQLCELRVHNERTGQLLGVGLEDMSMSPVHELPHFGWVSERSGQVSHRCSLEFQSTGDPVVMTFTAKPQCGPAQLIHLIMEEAADQQVEVPPIPRSERSWDEVNPEVFNPD